MGADKTNAISAAVMEPAAGRSRVPYMFRSLGTRDFALFWTGNFLSNIGTWMQTVALGWVILVKTNSPFLLGLNGFLSQIPTFLFAIPGGAIADRLNRRRLLLFAQTAMMFLALALAVMTSIRRINVMEILLISFLTGVASALNYPAYQSLYPDLVNRDDLVNAVALNSAQFNMSRAIGPTLAGLTLGSLGAAACFYLNSVSFLALIIALLVIVVPPREIQKGPSFWAEVMDGIRYYHQNPLYMILLTVPAFLSLLGLPFIVLMPVYARDLIKVGASGLGYLMAGAGLGAVISALVLAVRTKLDEWRGGTILASASIFALALILLAHAHEFWWAFFLLVVLGATMVGSLTLTNMTLQMSSPPMLRGRVMSLFLMAMSGLLPFGSLQAGAVAQTLGTRFALSWAGSVCLVYFLGVLILLPRLRREAVKRGNLRPA